MAKIIKEIRTTIHGHKVLVFDDESSYTFTRGEHEGLDLKVGDEFPPVQTELYGEEIKQEDVEGQDSEDEFEEHEEEVEHEDETGEKKVVKRVVKKPKAKAHKKGK